MMPKTCSDRSLTMNIRLVASCWFLSLHPTFMMCSHKSPKFTMVGCTLKEELGRIWKEASWPNLRYWPSICPVGSTILNSHPTQDSKWISNKYVRISDALVNLISHNLVVTSQEEYGMRKSSWQCNENTYTILWPANYDIFPNREITQFLTCNSVQKLLQ